MHGPGMQQHTKIGWSTKKNIVFFKKRRGENIFLFVKGPSSSFDYIQKNKKRKKA